MDKAGDDFLAACGAAIGMSAFACLFAFFVGDTPYQKGLYAGLWALAGIFWGRQSMRKEQQ